MQYAIAPNGERIQATKSTKAVCPGCRSPLMAKALTSKHVVPHWAHRAGDCDPWHEPETAWHRGWKKRWPEECREVVMGPHRADIRTEAGRVIELQHSPISSEEILERERFYGEGMLWILDARAWDIGLRDVDYVGESDSYGRLGSFPQYSVSFELLRELSLADGQTVDATWRRPKRSWSVAQEQVVLDIAPGCLLQVEWWGWAASVGCRVRGTIHIVDAREYAAHLTAWEDLVAERDRRRQETDDEVERFNRELLADANRRAVHDEETKRFRELAAKLNAARVGIGTNVKIPM